MCRTPDGDPAPEEAAKRVPCRRLDAKPRVLDHLDCPYCFGTAEEVSTGDHSRFCDFQPGKDPISFGFPEGFFERR